MCIGVLDRWCFYKMAELTNAQIICDVLIANGITMMLAGAAAMVLCSMHRSYGMV